MHYIAFCMTGKGTSPLTIRFTLPCKNFWGWRHCLSRLHKSCRISSCLRLQAAWTAACHTECCSALRWRGSRTGCACSLFGTLSPQRSHWSSHRFFQCCFLSQHTWLSVFHMLHWTFWALDYQTWENTKSSHRTIQVLEWWCLALFKVYITMLFWSSRWRFCTGTGDPWIYQW